MTSKTTIRTYNRSTIKQLQRMNNDPNLSIDDLQDLRDRLEDAYAKAYQDIHYRRR